MNKVLLGSLIAVGVSFGLFVLTGRSIWDLFFVIDNEDVTDDNFVVVTEEDTIWEADNVIPGFQGDYVLPDGTTYSPGVNATGQPVYRKGG